VLFPTYAFFLFFLVTFSVYWLGRAHAFRLTWLLFASIVFYWFWNPWFLFLIAGSTSIDYLVARALPRVTSPLRRRLLFATSVGVNLAILIGFKYSSFLLDTFATLASLAGISISVPVVSVVLPLGISFYTFEAISYIVDVYRGRLEPARSLLHYALYIMFFPHLIAGPIVRGHEFLPQLRCTKREDWPRLESAIRLFCLGLLKKVVLADHLAPIVDPVFAEPARYATSAVWLAMLGYSVQIYCDFSGYSDMAIAVARAFGIKLPENFRMPYFAPNITEFWRRWHMTLTRWLRDYVYIPLGGNRGTQVATYRNVLVTLAIGGLWHGAAWHFMVWGGYHGVLLAIHRALARGRHAALFRPPLSTAATYVAVCVGWVLFRAPSLPLAATMLARLVLPSPGVALAPLDRTIVVAILATMLVGHAVGTMLDVERIAWRLPAPLVGAAVAASIILIQLLAPAEGAAFIYFQF
jgi:alginate O-acetyltransferase complex protein AlgI